MQLTILLSRLLMHIGFNMSCILPWQFPASSAKYTSPTVFAACRALDVFYICQILVLEIAGSLCLQRAISTMSTTDDEQMRSHLQADAGSPQSIYM